MYVYIHICVSDPCNLAEDRHMWPRACDVRACNDMVDSYVNVERQESLQIYLVVCCHFLVEIHIPITLQPFCSAQR